MPDFEDFGKLAQSAVQQLHVRSALNPMLWLCGITTPMCFFAAYALREDPTMARWLVLAGFLPIAVTCAGFLGLAIFRPEKLQSEDYELRHEALQVIQQKTGRLVIAPASLEAIANPIVARALAEKAGDDA